MKNPKKTIKLKAKVNKIFCPSGFVAITLFGTVYMRDSNYLQLVNKTDGIDSILENHEMIHVKQAVSTHNSWLLFYILYIWKWILNLPLIFINLNAPYRFISFELEAYSNEANYGYQEQIVNGAYKWKKYDTLTMSEKIKLSKLYFNSKKYYPFRNFINNIIYPIVVR